MDKSCQEGNPMQQSEKFCSLDFLTRIKSERKKKNLTSDYCSSDSYPHAMVGMFLQDKKTEKVYLVQKAVRHWLWGYYIALLLVDGSDSHRLIHWENISSADSWIVESCDQTKFVVVNQM